MPIASGTRGLDNFLATPGRRPTRASVPFRSPKFSTTNPRITGTTRDSAGTALAACTVQLFRTVDDQYLGEAVSDGSGNYDLTAPGSGPFYIVAYKAGGTDVAGTSVNTLSAN